MKWRKARRGMNDRVTDTFKVERELKKPLKAYAKDQGVNKSDVVNTLLHNHKPLKPYLRQGTQLNDQDSNSNQD